MSNAATSVHWRGSRAIALLVAAAVAFTGAVVGTATSAQAATTFTISGTVTGATAASTTVPLTNVYVHLYKQNAEGDFVYADVGDGTDETGAYSIAAPSAGVYTMYYNHCESPTATSCQYGYVEEYLGHADYIGNATAVTLTESAATKTVNMQLDAASTITGTVKNSDGVALVEASIYAESGSSGRSTQTDATGTYTLSRVRAGSNIISARYSDYSSTAKDQQYYLETYWNNAVTKAAATPLVLTPGSSKTAINFVLAQAPSVRGRAVDAAGDPIPYLGFSPYTLDAASGLYRGPQSGPNGTDADGWFSRPLVPGSTTKIAFFDDLGQSWDGGATVTRTTPFESKFYKSSSTLEGATAITVGDSTQITMTDTVLAPFSGAIKMISPYRLTTGDSDGTNIYPDSVLYSPMGVTTTRQWYREGIAIAGATDYVYPYVAADKGASITQKVTVKRTGSTTATFTSDPYIVPGATLTATPVPTITGTTTVGSTLTADPGTWTPAPVTLTYTWLRDGTAISGATAATYKLVTADAGATISVAVKGAKTG